MKFFDSIPPLSDDIDSMPRMNPSKLRKFYNKVRASGVRFVMHKYEPHNPKPQFVDIIVNEKT